MAILQRGGVDMSPGGLVTNLHAVLDVVSAHAQATVDNASVGVIQRQQASLILRLVQSHRDLIAEWQKRKQMADQLAVEAKGSGDHLTAEAIAAGLWAAVTIVARGYEIAE